MLYAGVDLGQRRDHSAIAVVERRNLYRAYQAPVFHSVVLRHLERAPLGTPYPTVVERVRRVVGAGLREGGCSVAVDATGVGAPVVDMLRASLFGAKPLGCELAAVSITGGERERLAGGVWSVPKRDLMAGVQLLLEKRELVIGRGLREAGSLARELGWWKTRLTPGKWLIRTLKKIAEGRDRR